MADDPKAALASLIGSAASSQAGDDPKAALASMLVSALSGSKAGSKAES